MLTILLLGWYDMKIFHAESETLEIHSFCKTIFIMIIIAIIIIITINIGYFLYYNYSHLLLFSHYYWTRKC
jgi:hypothetical protein